MEPFLFLFVSVWTVSFMRTPSSQSERLAEDDWISHMRAKTKDFGEFVAAYLKACELAGITKLNIRIYEFACSHRYADE